MRLILLFISGLVFGTGLVISGMANPQKVQNFLDLFGNWDPSLAFVMGGAIAVTAPGYWLLRKRTQPLFSQQFYFPTRQDIDKNLLLGAAIFGIGWGIGGFCPGPAITAIPLVATGTLAFVPAMLVGMVIAKSMTRKNS